MRYGILGVILLLAAPAVGPAADAVIGAKPGAILDVVYKTTPQGKLSIHVHFPPDWKATDRRPALVFFFGGGWRAGSVKQFEDQAVYLAGRGLVTARADYRVKGRHDTTPDKCVEDCKSAVRWLRKHADDLGIDPKRLAAGGGSAGGHTAAAAATVPGLEAADEDTTISSKPNLLILFNPVLNTVPVADRFPSEEVARQCSPLHHLTREAPPTVVFFGTKDRFLPGSREYAAKARKLGAKVTIHTADEQPHGFFNRPPWKQATLAQADRFLTEHGYLKGPPTVKVPEGTALKKDPPAEPCEPERRGKGT